MLLIAQIWDAQKQELAGRVGATSRRIASKIAEVLHAEKTAKIVPIRQGPRSCLLRPQKRTCAVQWPMSALGQKQTSSRLCPLGKQSSDARHPDFRKFARLCIDLNRAAMLTTASLRAPVGA